MPDQPNIVIIICHDLGRHLHSYGIDEVNSPNIDQLAERGVKFTNAFCTAPQCSPSRASLFTGRYPHSNGVMGLAHSHFGWELHDEERHLVQILNDAGYFTAGLGILHETHTLDRIGFDTILPYNDSWKSDELTSSAVQFIENHAGQESPFYLQVGYVEPHRRPYGFDAPPDTENGVYIPPYLVDEYTARQDFAHFQGAIRQVDKSIGRLVSALDTNGLTEDTLIVFTTDHGIPFPRAKCSLTDAGLETALILHYPAAGWVLDDVDSMVSNIDILPTLVELLALDIPANVEGRSFLLQLRDEAYSERDAIFGEMTFHDYCDPRRCIRTNDYKLIVNFTAAPSFMDPSQQWRPQTITKHPVDPAFAYHPPVELYDLRNDPQEFENLAEDEAFEAVRKDHLRRLREWMQSTSDPLLDGIPNTPMFHTSMQIMQEASK